MTANKRQARTAEKTRGRERRDEWTAQHFSLANPEGPGQERLPPLLNRLATNIRSLGDVEILDITFQAEITADGVRPHFTVYYYRPGTKAR